MTILILLHISILLSYGIPIGFFISYGLYLPAIILIFSGLIWVFPKLRNRAWLQIVSLVLGIAGNVFGAILNFPVTEILLSTVLMLGTWEYANFYRYLQLASEEDSVIVIRRRHSLISIIFLALVFVISLSVVLVKIEPSFYQAIILVVLTFLGVIQLIRWLISTSKET